MDLLDALRSAAEEQGCADAVRYRQRSPEAILGRALLGAGVPGATNKHGKVTRKRRERLLAPLTELDRQQVLRAYWSARRKAR